MFFEAIATFALRPNHSLKGTIQKFQSSDHSLHWPDLIALILTPVLIVIIVAALQAQLAQLLGVF